MSFSQTLVVRLANNARARAGYVLAEMSVQQTRAHFLRKYGALVDRPEVGARAYAPCAGATHVLHKLKLRVDLGVMGNALRPKATPKCCCSDFQ